MKLERLHQVCTEKGYNFTYKNDITTISGDVDVSFRIKKLPDNLHFKNKGIVKLELLAELPITTVFKNKSDVRLGNNTVIPKGFTGFEQSGNLIPENISFKKPKIKYYFSEEFCYFLSENKKNKWIAKLTKLNNTFVNEENFNYSFIDCVDDISFIPVDKIYKKYIAASKKRNWTNIENYLANNKDQLLKEGLKNKMKPGRFIKAIFPEITNAEIEEFTNAFKGFKDSKDCGLEIIKGDEIVKYYNRKYQDTSNNGRLYNSCMNYTDPDKDIKFKNLHFYAKVPNCGLLILRDKGAEKIRGRAFIWTCKNDKTYVDVPYTAKESDMFIYKRYIKINNCLSYTNGDSVKGLVIECPSEVQSLTHYMPYLDTLKYDKKKNIISGDKYN